MIVINTISNDRFSLNGVEYFKNFLSFVSGNNVAVYNAYDSRDQRINAEIYSNFIVNGVVYASALLLQQALIGVIYTRDSLGAVNTVLQGSVTPSSTPIGTGKAFWVATQAGTYTNFGGVVVSANSFAVISRDALGAFSISQTTFDITSKVNVSDVIDNLISTDTNKPLSAKQGKALNDTKVNVSDVINTLASTETTKPLSAAQGKVLNEKNIKIETWTAKSYLSGDQVNYLGKDWVSNAATVAGDIPGTSSKWVERLSAYNFTEKLSLKANLTVGKNLFNWQDADVILNSVLGGDGSINGGNSGLIITGFIPVIPAQVIVSNRSSVGWGNNYYDANKVRLSTTTSTAALTIPAGAFYLRKTVSLGGLGLEAAQIQIELGSISSVFEAYKLSVPTTELGNTVLKTELQPAIELNNTLFLTKSPNLFDENDFIESSFLGTTGIVGTFADSNISNYIPLNSGQVAYIFGGFSAGFLNLCFYNENKGFISSVAQNTYTNTITGVSGCKFFRFSYPKRHRNQSYIQVYHGTTKIAYTPKGWSLTERFIKPSYGENLINKDDCYAGSVDEATGFLGNLSDNRTSRMIKIKTGAKLYSNTDFNVKVVEYDVNMAYLRGVQTVFKNTPKILGSNTEYVRISTNVNQWTDNFMVRNSEAAIDLNYYVPFTETLDQPVRPLPTIQDICLPKKIWGISGQQIDIFHTPMKRRYIFDNTYLQFDGLSNYENKSFKTLSSSSAVDAFVYDSEFLKKKKVSTTLVPSNVATDNGNVKVHPIGDSITYINNQYKYVNTNCPNLTFVGSLFYSANSPLAHDGRPGWTLDNYFAVIKSPVEYPAFSPFMHPTDLTLNYIGCTKFWISAYNNAVYDRDMKAKGDAMGGFNTTTGVKTTPATNDVMYFYSESVYKKWDGSSWVTITPTFSFNYAKFLSVWSIATPNIVPIMLGTNDFSRVSDITAIKTFNAAWKAQLDTVIASIQAVSATIKIAVIIPPYRATKKSLYGNWNAPINASMYEQRKLILSSYDDREGEKIYVIDCGTAVDTESDYDVDGNGFVTDTVHPSLSGNNNMGKRIAAFIQGNR